LLTVRVDVLICLDEPDSTAKGLVELNKLLKLLKFLFRGEFKFFDGKMLVFGFLVFEMFDLSIQKVIFLSQILKMMVCVGQKTTLRCVTHEIVNEK
jgi:hypothetical protein